MSGPSAGSSAMNALIALTLLTFGLRALGGALRGGPRVRSSARELYDLRLRTGPRA